ncbi:esterase-like activity of phytase family protein [Beggiatoa leptomitoformis]|uniref:Esterase-like activity of phytase family protein n=1 Tax=Beggiatoa leptomitoformis TaxID=288004 RepID=A0A2N9YII5_9GAMM|nr:esterase-like activity of phytase family protein [Beggiatoa leptomitoformis]ALG67445.2 esterase-like activity of phytase family protein [Beggiatoa leptomitoformis]AUI70338.2 esterase-like activity of phytase family protein [Beggiatoa leptomitoformis]
MPYNLIFLLLFLLTACTSVHSQPYPLSRTYAVNTDYMQIRLRGTVQIPTQEVDNLTLGGLSGLAWDEDEQLLYAVSDTGRLFHLRLTFEHQQLREATPIKAVLLKNKQGIALNTLRRQRDAEGLSIRNGNNGIQGDSELIIAFERNPRIERYQPTGEWLGAYSLPNPLKNIDNYLSINDSLESVTLHPQYGILTAPEHPLKSETAQQIRIFNLQGQSWTLPSHTAPNSAVTDLAVMDDGTLLLLERAFTSIFSPLIISLRRVQLCTQKTGNTTNVQELAVFDSSKGWSIDNFEGLTHHHSAFFLMVSDDNYRSFQTTLLSYIEIINQPPLPCH